MREILKELDEKMTPSDLDEMIEEIDIDGSGTVDWEGKLKMNNNYWFTDICSKFLEFKAMMIG